MHSPGQAIAWLFWWRHRWGLAAGIVYLFAAVATVALVPPEVRTGNLGLNLTVSSLAVLLHLMVVFSFGFETDLANKDSGYPPRMFVLPLATRTLVRWPMFGGLISVSLVWLVIAGLVLRPCGFGFVWWPWACLTALLAVLQALAWMPFSSSYQRLVVVLLLAGVAALAAMGLIWLVAPTAVFASLFVAVWLSGYRLALAAVARARRGDPVRWPWSTLVLKLASGERHSVAPVLRGGEGVAPMATASHRPAAAADGDPRLGRRPGRSRTPVAFRSATRAQLWFECRRHGWLLPLFMAIALAFAAPIVFVSPNNGAPPWRIAAIVLALAPFLAGIGSTAFGKEDPLAKTYELSSFAATRPLTSAQMVGVKFVVAGVSAGLMCGLTLIALAPWFFRSDIHAGFASMWQGVPAWRAAAVALLALVGWLAITWKQIVASLWCGLTGRTWLVNAVGFAYALLFMAVLIIPGWFIVHREHLPLVREWLRTNVPAIVGLALAAKALAATALWNCRPGTGRRLFAKSAVVWLAIAVAVAGAGVWLMPAALSPPWLTMSAALLLVPFNRLAAAPLALDWNRHR